MEVFQRAPDPIIVVEVMRRPQPSSTTSPPVFPTPRVGGGGGLCSSSSGPGGAGDSNSEMSSFLSTRRGTDSVGGVCSGSGATRSVAVQTVFSAGEMAASLAIAAASFAQQEARMALLGEPALYDAYVTGKSSTLCPQARQGLRFYSFIACLLRFE